MKKRLLKDLPFENIKAGTVIFYGSHGHGHGSTYCINRGEALYESGGSSSNGCSSFNETEVSILDAIWNNPEWFIEAKLKHIDIIARTNEIILRFDSLDMDDAQMLARGIQHWIMISNKEDDNHAWSEFRGFTTKLK